MTYPARNRKTNFIWTDEAIETLVRMWGEGRSAGEIALVLRSEPPLSRNSVIGKITRLGLPGRKSGVRIKLVTPPRVERRAPPKLAPTPLPGRLTRDELWAPPPSGGVAIVDLPNFGACKWPCFDKPSDPKLFCGEPTGGETAVYCRHHRLASVDRTSRANLRMKEAA